MWSLYGKTYDFTEFAKRHPGGTEIIEKSRGLPDCTALFESYHAFSDISGIMQSLNKYEVKSTTPAQADTQIDDFSNYRELVNRVKQYYPDRAFIKAQSSWQIWTGIIGCVYCFLLWGILTTDNTLIKLAISILGGITEMSLLFNVLHDSSHYAISLDANTNTRISKLVNGWAWWNHTIWFYHHVYYHHSFTGGNRDADEELYRLKAPLTKISPNCLEWFTNVTFIIFPGQHVTQIFWYLYNSVANEILFLNKKSFFIPADYDSPQPTIIALFKNVAKNYNPYSICTMLLKIALFRSMGLPSTCLYLIGVNATYYINIIADHDLFETHENHYDGPDWAKRQICNSGNFANDNALWTTLFGGINYQIEHHLFPNVCNSNYPEISKIVRQFCKEKGFPYSCQPTVIDAYKSFMKKQKKL